MTILFGGDRALWAGSSRVKEPLPPRQCRLRRLKSRHLQISGPAQSWNKNGTSKFHMEQTFKFKLFDIFKSTLHVCQMTLILLFASNVRQVLKNFFLLFFILDDVTNYTRFSFGVAASDFRFRPSLLSSQLRRQVQLLMQVKQKPRKKKKENILNYSHLTTTVWDNDLLS